jgi:xylan 1,4-beta-xylosidase
MPRIANPVLTGFHADPSILRVGDEYFIANSTFEWYPGVEIHRSKDLATWESVPSPLSEKRLLDMDGAIASCGIWAPCLSYADGLFWLIYTNVRSWNSGPWKDTPNFLTTAPSIEGPWSDPVFLNCSGFDPSLFHDDDGRTWIVNMEWDYRKTGSGQFSGILLQEYLPKEKRLAGTVRKIFKGSSIGLVEGPHLYKRGLWYYVLAAEGGTTYEHAATVARSRSIEGPYELHPDNPLLSSYGRPGIALQKSGHASWCDSPDGRTYLAFLCSRPVPGTQYCPLGRETGIVELTWKDGWPYVKHEDGKLFEEGIARNYPDDSFEPPASASGRAGAGAMVAGAPASAARSVEYRFDGASIPIDFKSLRTERPAEAYSLSARPGFLRLRGGQSPVSRYGQTLLARRQTDFAFDAETRLEFAPTSFQHMAGLCWRYDEESQYLAAVSRDEEKGRVVFVITMVDGAFARSLETKIPDEGPVWLGVSARGATGSFRYSLDGKRWMPLRPTLDATVLSDEFGGQGFTGAFVGMFCVDTEAYRASADFEFFSYTVR